jgi:hypothetical protein
MTRTRKWLHAVAALILVLGLLWITAGAALAQLSPSFSLGCWSITTSGGDARQSTNFRIRDAVTYVGGSMQAGAARIDSNHFLLARAYRPPSGAVQPPAVDATVIRLPLVFDQSLVLQQLCR